MLWINKMKTSNCICCYINHFMCMLTELNRCWVTQVIGDSSKVSVSVMGVLEGGGGL